ncbi:hypothetical protein B0H16DRAFT_1746000 [Mycena metata]|uniref:DOT1 domain-containing protein n=1 Tax=Mycena metata TaxID=1033252 RepID=A0AAD7H059_9AGAR|nr:hypothetical protein B0H16DRAFT_1746000 [Mycena metata]
MYAALLCRCDTVSYEIALGPAQIAVPLFRTVAQKCGDSGYSMGSHAFIHADTMIDPSVGRAIACAKVILIDNKEFPDDLTMWIDGALQKSAPGNHIFVTQQLDTVHSSASSENARTYNDISLSMDRLPDIEGRLGWAHREIVVFHYVVRGDRPSVPSFWPDGAGSSLWQPTDPPHETSCVVHSPRFYFSVPHNIPGASPELYHHREYSDGSVVEERLHAEKDVPHWGHVTVLKGRGAARKRAKRRKQREGQGPFSLSQPDASTDGTRTSLVEGPLPYD